MKYWLASACAQLRATKTGRPFVAIKARNGQWLCEDEKFASTHYPKEAERKVFMPEKPS